MNKEWETWLVVLYNGVVLGVGVMVALLCGLWIVTFGHVDRGNGTSL